MSAGYSSATITPEKEADLRKELIAAEGVADSLSHDAATALMDIFGDTREIGQEVLLSRVLRACEYIVPKAAHVLASIIKWRAEKNVPGILNDDAANDLFKRAAPYWPVGLGTHPSDDGCVLEVWRIGQFWPTEFLQVLSTEEIHSVWLMHMEKGLDAQAQARKQSGQPKVNGIVMVFDLDGMTTRHLNTDGLKQLSDVLGLSQRYYVENVRSIVVVNAGKVFEMAWAVIKQVLHPNTVAKVSVHADSGIADLAARIGSLDKVPAFLGGKDEVTQIGNRTHMGEGEVVVAAGQTHWVVIEVTEVKEPPPVLEVMFESKDYDMDFGVFWYPAEKKNKEVELIAVKKYNSHVAPVQVEATLPTGKGTLRLAFDNVENMVYSKTIWVQHRWIEKK